MIFHLSAMLPNRAQLSREGAISRRDQPGIAERSEIFGWKEREAAEDANPANRPAAITRPNRLRGILHDRHTRTFSGIENRRHVGALAEQVHGHNCLRPRGDGSSDRARIDIERAGIDVGEHWPRAKPRNRTGCRKKRKRGRHHFVPRPDAERHQSREQRIRAR
jgi:hypothetical protein